MSLRTFHTPRVEIYLADSLSRPNREETCSVYSIISVEVEAHADQKLRNVLLDRQVLIIQASMVQDKACNQLSELIEQGWPKSQVKQDIRK